MASTVSCCVCESSRGRSPRLPIGHVVDADGAEGEAFEAHASFSRVEA
jgi:hypothetical protein